MIRKLAESISRPGVQTEGPRTVAAIVGPPQSGKKTVVRALAQAIGVNVIFFDLSATQDRQPFEETVISFLDTYPEGIVVIDRFHRASDEIRGAVRRLVTSPVFSAEKNWDGRQPKVVTRHASVIFTTQAGDREPEGDDLSPIEEIRIRNQMLEEGFDPEVLARINTVIPMKGPESEAELAGVLRYLFEKFSESKQGNNSEVVTVTKDSLFRLAAEHLFNRYYKIRFARPLDGVSGAHERPWTLAFAHFEDALESEFEQRNGSHCTLRLARVFKP